MATLIAHSGALGDFITTLPAMAAWRLLHPREPLILLGKPAFAAVAEPRLFDEVWDVERHRFSALFGTGPVPAKALLTHLGAITEALVFAQGSSPLPATLAAACGGRIVRQDPFPRDRVHIVDYHLSLFPPAVAAAAGRIPRVIVGKDDGAPSGLIALHPGSGSPRKNWPYDRFAALASRLEGEGKGIAWVVGPAEETIESPAGGILWKEVGLPALAARLARCDCYIGNDSGVTHLAAAAGCPTIALFGASDAMIWAPRGRSVRIVQSRTKDMEGITVEMVLREWRSLYKGEKN